MNHLVDQYFDSLSDKKVAVLGIGVSNRPLIRMLLARGIHVLACDKTPREKLDAEVLELEQAGAVLHVGEGYLDDVRADVVFRTPGMHPEIPALRRLRAAGAEITSEMEAFFEVCPCPILAVTGSDGKTTTTTLIAKMLQAAGKTVWLGGNIGTPLSEYILSGEKADVVVLELSSFQLQTCSTLHPRVGILLNISENHLDFHKDMDEYISAKMRLFANQTETDLAVLQDGMDELAGKYGIKARKIHYTESDRFPGMQLMGPHNRCNAEAAWLACREFGVTEEAAARAVAAFQPLEHRLEKVAEINGVQYVNDSKCTTVEALRVALSSFDRPVVLLAGGKFKGGDLPGLCPLLKEHARCVALFGASRERFEPAWRDTLPVTWDRTLEQALRRVAGKDGQPALAHEGDVVLLAPACSSYDQYPNYLRRGEDFKRVVHEVLA